MATYVCTTQIKGAVQVKKLFLWTLYCIPIRERSKGPGSIPASGDANSNTALGEISRVPGFESPWWQLNIHNIKIKLKIYYIMYYTNVEGTTTCWLETYIHQCCIHTHTFTIFLIYTIYLSCRDRGSNHLPLQTSRISRLSRLRHGRTVF